MPDFLRIVLPDGVTNVSLDVTFKAQDTAPKSGVIEVDFPALGTPSIRFVDHRA